jgi:hypothetical protein
MQFCDFHMNANDRALMHVMDDDRLAHIKSRLTSAQRFGRLSRAEGP